MLIRTPVQIVGNLIRGWYRRIDTGYVVGWMDGRNSYASVLIRSNKMQQYAGIYLLRVYSTCFGRPLRPSSGVQKTVTAASGTGHSNGARPSSNMAFRPRWRKVVTPLQ